ncbi:MAG: hypothetical protein FWB71_04810 [Defluviitaleaceae bacterium]|nr:hypothetical protein [Defluviitaleaceae bacterium]
MLTCFRSYRIMIIAVFIFGVVFLSACNRSPNIQQDVDFARYFQDRSLFVGETLTISLCNTSFYGSLISMRAREFMAENEGVYIEVNIHATQEGFASDVTTRLFAGTADTLIMVDTATFHLDDISLFKPFDWRNPNFLHFFADFLPIMKAVNDFDKTNWHMNALDAMTIDERLVIFPITFIYNAFIANSNIAGLSDVFEQRAFISLENMMDLHEAFTCCESMGLYPNFNASNAIPLLIYRHLDFENRVANFNNETFINFLKSLKALTLPTRGFPEGGFPIVELFYSNLYLFFDIESAGVWFRMAYDTDELTFRSPTPLVDSDGNLQIASLFSFALNDRATPVQQALAFDFIQFLLCPRFWSGYNDTRRAPMLMGISPYRPVQFYRFEHFFPQHVWGNFDEGVMQSAIEFYNRIAEMPVTIRYPIPNTIFIIIEQIIGQFVDELIDAREAAELLQNRITIVLMEMD